MQKGTSCGVLHSWQAEASWRQHRKWSRQQVGHSEGGIAEQPRRQRPHVPAGVRRGVISCTGQKQVVAGGAAHLGAATPHLCLGGANEGRGWEGVGDGEWNKWFVRLPGDNERPKLSDEVT